MFVRHMLLEVAFCLGSMITLRAFESSVRVAFERRHVTRSTQVHCGGLSLEKRAKRKTDSSRTKHTTTLPPPPCDHPDVAVRTSSHAFPKSATDSRIPYTHFPSCELHIAGNALISLQMGKRAFAWLEQSMTSSAASSFRSRIYETSPLAPSKRGSVPCRRCTSSPTHGNTCLVTPPWFPSSSVPFFLGGDSVPHPRTRTPNPKRKAPYTVAPCYSRPASSFRLTHPAAASAVV